MNNDVRGSHKINQMGKHKTDLLSKHRRSIRIPEYDYSQAGAYFITVFTQNWACLFGHIQNNEMVLNDAGMMIDQVCQEIPQFLQGVGLDHYQIMHNHFHGIIMLNPFESQQGHDLTVGGRPPCLPCVAPFGQGNHCSMRSTGESAPRRVAPTQNPMALYDVV